MAVIIVAVPFQKTYSEESGIGYLDSLINEALINNPEIQASYESWKAARYKAKRVSGLPDPMARYTYFGESVETKVGPQEHKYGISQKIPFPGKLHLKKKAESKRADMLKEKHDATKREVIKSIKFVYYDIFWVDKAIDITRGEKNILETLEKVAKRKYETTHSPQQDVIKAQVEISGLIDKLFMLKQHRKSLEAKMNALLNRAKGAPFHKPEEVRLDNFEYNLEDLHNLAAGTRQEVMAANLDTERAKYEKSLAWLNFLPDFSFGFDYIQVGGGTTGLDNDGDDAWTTTFALHVPIWLSKQVAEVKEKKASLRASKKNYENVKNSVASEVEDVYYRIHTYKDIVSLYKTALVPQTQQAFDAARLAYETGKVDFLNWIDSERVLLKTRLAYYKAVVDYEKSIAYLERIVGRNL
jgi:outer membrane protein TolC